MYRYLRMLLVILQNIVIYEYRNNLSKQTVHYVLFLNQCIIPLHILSDYHTV